MTSVLMTLYHLITFTILVESTKQIIIPLFKENCDATNEERSARVFERAPNGNAPATTPLVCKQHNHNYGIIKIGIDQSTVHRNSPVNSDGSRDFKVVFDTGSAATWVFGVSRPQPGDYKMSYYKSAKIVAKRTKFLFSASYDGGRLTSCGRYYMDKVCIESVCAHSQFVAIVRNYDCFKITHFEGVFGMSNFRDPSARRYNIDKLKDNAYSVLEHILMSNRLDNVFALWLHSTGGEVSLGSPDIRRYYRPIKYTPVIPNPTHHWKIQGSYFLINYETKINMSEVVLDSGSDFIFGPEETIIEIYNKLPVDEDGYFSCDKIHTFPKIVVVLENYRVLLTPKDYVINRNLPLEEIIDPELRKWQEENQMKHGYNRCHCGFIKSTDWLFGETFLRKVYTVFDAERQQVGFASPKHG